MTQSRPEPKVIVIPAKEESPQDQEKKKNLRVAAYCRVSTKKDEQLNSYRQQQEQQTQNSQPVYKSQPPTGRWRIFSRMKASQALPPASARIFFA